MVPVTPAICTLSISSLKELVAIDAEVGAAPWSSSAFAREFRNSVGRVYGARYEGRLVGFLVCHVVADEVHILNLGVVRELQRCGIARALLTSVLHTLYREAVKKAVLEVRTSNLPARRLYKKAGFSEIGVRTEYYRDNREDAQVLQLDLQYFVDTLSPPQAGS